MLTLRGFDSVPPACKTRALTTRSRLPTIDLYFLRAPTDYIDFDACPFSFHLIRIKLLDPKKKRQHQHKDITDMIMMMQKDMYR